jgi:hypothetical protein
LFPAETAPLLARAIWTDMSILLALEALGHAAFWVVCLHILHVIPHHYSFLDQAVRLCGVVDSHDQAGVLFLSFDVSQPADILYFQAWVKPVVLCLNPSRVLFPCASRVIRYPNAVHEYWPCR